jgi:hypothetical protein
MRLRRHYKNYKRDENSQVSEDELGVKGQETTHKQIEDEAREPKHVKESKSVKPFKMIRQIINNPNFNMQLMVILLSLSSDNLQMDRRIDGMTTTIDKVRNITELVNNGMQSMKMVSEVPKSIRRILE